PRNRQLPVASAPGRHSSASVSGSTPSSGRSTWNVRSTPGVQAHHQSAAVHSSVCPSQSLSTPSGRSGVGALIPTQPLWTIRPPVQLVVTVPAQAPGGPQAAVWVGNPSSAAPLQLSSQLSQVKSLVAHTGGRVGHEGVTSWLSG